MAQPSLLTPFDAEVTMARLLVSQPVELIAELELQIIAVLVARVKVTKLFELLF